MIKDYELNVQYHPGKANVVAYALRRKACSLNAMLKERLPALYEELEGFGLELVALGFLANLEVKPTLMNDVKEAQKGHESIEGIKRKIKAVRPQDSQRMSKEFCGLGIAFAYPTRLSSRT